MAKGVYAALSGAVATQVAVDTTAQNLANASTAGYQKLRPLFREALAQAGAPAGRPPGPSQNHYAATTGTVIDLSPGVIRTTGRQLDVALPPETFLAVSTPRGERYTRAGDIQVSPDGRLRVANADLSSETGNPIVVDPRSDVSISADGQVFSGGEALARIKLVSFAEPSLLTPEGATTLAVSPGSGPPSPASGELKTGHLEESNASPVIAMTDLMSATRMFEACQRAIETFREADRKIVTLPST